VALVGLYGGRMERENKNPTPFFLTTPNEQTQPDPLVFLCLVVGSIWYETMYRSL
jgi:hypothetical protein